MKDPTTLCLPALAAVLAFSAAVRGEGSSGETVPGAQDLSAAGVVSSTTTPPTRAWWQPGAMTSRDVHPAPSDHGTAPGNIYNPTVPLDRIPNSADTGPGQ